MNNILFLSEESNRENIKNGYITVNLLTEEEIKELTAIYHTYDKDYSDFFYCSNWSTNCDERRNEHLAISEIIAPKLSALLSGYKILYSCFITKRRSLHVKVHPHIDWQFVSEPDFAAYNIWIPLTDTNPLNGNLWVASGSHHHVNGPRGPNIETALKEEWYEDTKNLNLKAGRGVIYDTRLIHGSNRNILSKKRIAIAMIIVPENATVLHHFSDPESKAIHTYKVDDSFYLERCNFRRKNNYWDLSPGLTKN